MFRNDLIDVNRTGRLKGLFLGCCELGNLAFIKFLLGVEPKTVDKNRLQWVAGYGREVEWIKSSAIDMLFWNFFFSSDRESERAKVTDACQRLSKFAPGAFTDLKFNVFLRKRGRGGGRVMSVIDNDVFPDDQIDSLIEDSDIAD